VASPVRAEGIDDDLGPLETFDGIAQDAIAVPRPENVLIHS
jgi:hypothetical protein